MRDRIKRAFSRVDMEILGGLVVFFLLAWGFVEIADEVRQKATLSVDERILLWLREGNDLSDPLGPGWLEEMMRDFTSLGGVAVVGLIVVSSLGYLLLQHRPRSALFLLVAVVGGVVLGDVLKALYDRPRPEVVPHLVEVLSESFPSGHTTMAAVVYPTLGAMLTRVVSRTRTRIYLLVASAGVACLVGFSRMYLGVHYPTDVMAGLALGFGWALLCWLTVRYLQKRRRVEPEPAMVEGAAGDAEATGRV